MKTQLTFFFLQFLDHSRPYLNGICFIVNSVLCLIQYNYFCVLTKCILGSGTIEACWWKIFHRDICHMSLEASNGLFEGHVQFGDFSSISAFGFYHCISRYVISFLGFKRPDVATVLSWSPCVVGVYSPECHLVNIIWSVLWLFKFFHGKIQLQWVLTVSLEQPSCGREW